MKLTGITATTNPCSDGRDFRFSEDDLISMGLAAPGQLVFADFDRTSAPVGRIESAEIEYDTAGGRGDEPVAKLRVVVNMPPAFAGPDTPRWPAGKGELYCVPGCVCTSNKFSRLTSFGMTRTPADKTITPLELLGPEPQG